LFNDNPGIDYFTPGSRIQNVITRKGRRIFVTESLHDEYVGIKQIDTQTFVHIIAKIKVCSQY